MAIATFSTWTTYGAWLPGDPRGWYKRNKGPQEPDERLHEAARDTLVESPVLLDPDQRRIVEKTIARHCEIRGWKLHAVNCRTNHVHAVFTASNVDIEVPREQFKAWCTTHLRPTDPKRVHWWTPKGWDEYIDDDDDLAQACEYTWNQ